MSSTPPAAWRYDYVGKDGLRARRVQLERWENFHSQHTVGTETPLYAAPPPPESHATLLARVQRALRLYPEWCAGWGLLRNQNAATAAAEECASMLGVLPGYLPPDDEEAGYVIHKAILAGQQGSRQVTNAPTELSTGERPSCYGTGQVHHPASRAENDCSTCPWSGACW